MKIFERIPLRTFSHRRLHYDLNELYSSIEKSTMGKYYRTNGESMMEKGNITSLRPASAKPEEIKYYMNKLVDYINAKRK